MEQTNQLIKELKQIRVQVSVASRLRTLPNNYAGMNPRLGKWLNVMGKDLEVIDAELRGIIAFLENGELPTIAERQALKQHGRIKLTFLETIELLKEG